MAVAVLWGGLVSADKVVLNDGRELEGTVVIRDQTVTVVVGEKLYQVQKSQVTSHNGVAMEPASAKVEAQAPAAPAVAPGPTGKNPVVKISTSKGDMTVELFEDKVPNTVANFITLAEQGFYKGMRFHRIIPGFMAQGGCPNSKEGAQGVPGTGGPGYKFANECRSDLQHDGRGILSMANSGPNTNGSQFFICFKATPHLDGKHTVFGKVISGLDVLDKLEAAGTQTGKPTEDVEFSVEVLSKQDHPYTVNKL